MCLDPVVEGFFNMMGGDGYIPLWGIFLRILYLLDFIFSEIVWIDKLRYVHEGIFFPNNGCHGNRKKEVSQLS